jgi:hypothetical protein
MNFSESHFDKLQDYAQKGFKGNLSKEEQEYYNTLLAVLGVYRKYGRQGAIRMLMVEPFFCTRRVATRMFDESINLFYADDSVERKAWRNLMFEEMRLAALSILKTVGITPDDFETYRRLMESAYKFKQLEAPDPEKPDNLEKRLKGIKLYMLNGHMLGLANINRDEVGSLIDNLDVSERDKERLKTDAGLKPVDIDNILDNTIAISEDNET